MVIVKAIILAGLADLKSDFYDSRLLDKRLSTHVINVVDIQHGGYAGFKVDFPPQKGSDSSHSMRKRREGMLEDKCKRDSRKGERCAGSLECLGSGVDNNSNKQGYNAFNS